MKVFSDSAAKYHTGLLRSLLPVALSLSIAGINNVHKKIVSKDQIAAYFISELKKIKEEL